VKLNDTLILPYQRYPTCMEVVRGSIYVPNQGTLTLTWDNSYSRMRNKFLTYTVRVFSKSSFDTAKLLAQQAENDRSVYVRHRHTLRKYLLQASKNLLSMCAKGDTFKGTGLPEINMSSGRGGGVMSVSLGVSSLSENCDHEAEEEMAQEAFDRESGTFCGDQESNRAVERGESKTVSIGRRSFLARSASHNSIQAGSHADHLRNSLHSRSLDAIIDDEDAGVFVTSQESSQPVGKRASFILKLEDEKASLIHALQSAERTLAEERQMNGALLHRLEGVVLENERAVRERDALQLRVETLLSYSDEVPMKVDLNDSTSITTVELEHLHVHKADLNAETSVELPADAENADVNDYYNTSVVASDEAGQARLSYLQQRNSYLEDLVLSLKSELDAVSRPKQMQEFAVAKLKSEKKALKDYIAKLKSDLETVAKQQRVERLPLVNTQQTQHMNQAHYNFPLQQRVPPASQATSETMYDKELVEHSLEKPLSDTASEVDVTISTPFTPFSIQLASIISPMDLTTAPVMAATTYTTFGSFGDTSSTTTAPSELTTAVTAATTGNLDHLVSNLGVKYSSTAGVAKKKALLDEDMRDEEETPVRGPTVTKKRMSMLGDEEVYRSNEGSDTVDDCSLHQKMLQYLPPTPSEIDLNSSEQALLGCNVARTTLNDSGVNTVGPISSPAGYNTIDANGSHISPSNNLAVYGNKPVISDETVELVDEMIMETSVAAQKAISSIWEFGKALVANNNVSGKSAGGVKGETQSFVQTTYEF
jgi:hypothetical protein